MTANFRPEKLPKGPTRNGLRLTELRRETPIRAAKGITRNRESKLKTVAPGKEKSKGTAWNSTLTQGQPLSPRRKRSTGRQKQRDALYKLVARAYLEAHPICEFPGCYESSVDIHHTRGRAGDLLTDTRYFKAPCRFHHDDCHRSIGERRQMYINLGWIVTRHRGGELDREDENGND